jgi:uncharacterized protein (DUF983 family)
MQRTEASQNREKTHSGETQEVQTQAGFFARPARRAASALELKRNAVANAPMNQSPEHHPDFERWPPLAQAEKPEWNMPDWPTTIWRGICGRCPHCGKAPIFDGYLKVHKLCLNCAAPLGDMPADDVPPYVAMVVVLQVLAIFVVLFFKGYFRPGLIMSGFLLVILTLICMVALRLAKGAIIGIMLKLGLKREVLHG